MTEMAERFDPGDVWQNRISGMQVIVRGAQADQIDIQVLDEAGAPVEVFWYFTPAALTERWEPIAQVATGNAISVAAGTLTT